MLRIDPLGVEDLAPILVFAVLSLVAELKPINLGRYQGAISMGTALDLTALFLFGPAVIVVMAFLSEVVINLFLRRGGWRTVFNMSQLVVSNAATGLAYTFLRFHQGPIDFIRDTPAITVAVGLRLLINMTAVAVALAIQRGLPLWKAWKDLTSRAPLAHYLFQAPLGVLAALVFQHEPVAVVLVLVPLYINYVGIRRYVALSELNDQLEEMVSKRTQDLVVLNEKLESAYRRLQDEEENRRQLMANISHDLRTPLSSIRGYVEALLDGVAQSEAQFRRYLAVIHDKTQMLDRLIDDLFQLSCLENGQLEMNFQSGDLGEFLSSIIGQWRVEVENAGLSLRENLPVDLTPVSFDAARMQQVLSNLISNAIRHTPPGGEIRVTLQQTGNRAVLAVEDTGEGIPPDDLPRVFDRFYRGEKSRSRRGGGSGLGLAIVKQIILSHNGTIEVESFVGKGTKFLITLPVYTPHPIQS